MTSRGIYDDGWVGRNAHVVLQGGDPTDLVLRAHVLPCPDQHLEIRVNGDVIASRAIAPGPLELRLPIGASESERRIELDWKETTQPNDGDARQAAALVTFLNVTMDRPPRGLRIPGGLAHPGARVSGIYPDGWAEGQSRMELASGDAAELVVRGAVPEALHDQTLEILVAGTPVFAGPVPPGPFDIRVMVDRTDDARSVELRWSAVSAISDGDRREAAALLSFVGVASGPAPTSIRRFPTDLADPNVRHNGIYADGWLEGEASVTLAGGPAGDLVIRAEIPSAIEQQGLEVRIGGETVGSAVANDHAINLRLPLDASADDRDVVLAWRRQAVLSQGDTRSVSAHLTLLAIATGQPPNAIARFPATSWIRISLVPAFTTTAGRHGKRRLSLRARQQPTS